MAAPPKRNTTNEYHGPSPKEMIANHTLAKEIIDRHNDPCPIFDDPSILLLREFVQDPPNARTILAKRDLLDGEAEKPGTKANSAGNLAAYLIAKHGSGEDALIEEEIKNLEDWFDTGGGKTDAELAAAL
ncbi:hypothetical protein SCUP234_05077 [Seiridium cupressi]